MVNFVQSSRKNLMINLVQPSEESNDKSCSAFGRM